MGVSFLVEAVWDVIPRTGRVPRSDSPGKLFSALRSPVVSREGRVVEPFQRSSDCVRHTALARAPQLEGDAFAFGPAHFFRGGGETLLEEGSVIGLAEIEARVADPARGGSAPAALADDDIISGAANNVASIAALSVRTRSPTSLLPTRRPARAIAIRVSGWHRESLPSWQPRQRALPSAFVAHSSQHTSTVLPPIFTLIALASSG